MDIKLLNYKNIELVKDFVLPNVLESEECSEYWFVTAIDEKEGVLGVLTLNPLAVEPSILSIAVTPSHHREGIATTLIKAAKEKIYEGGENSIYAVTSDEAVKSLLEHNNFEIVNEFNTYRFTAKEAIDKISGGKALKEAKRIVSFKELEDKDLRDINNYLAESGIYSMIKRDEYDAELSVFSVKEDEVTGGILVSKLDEKLLEISWLYQSSDEDSKNLINLFMQLCLLVQKKGLSDAEILVTCLEEKIDKFVQSMISGVKPVNTMRAYKYHIAGVQEDPVFEAVDTTVQKSCEGCKYHTGDYMSCDLYDRKPGCVFYDEKCPSYEAE